MVSTIVFGPKPEAIIASVIPDTFDYLNWIYKFYSHKVNLKLAIKNEEDFTDKIDTGSLWNVNLFLHSFWISGLTGSLSLLFWFSGNGLLFVFFASYFLHIAIDYVTHTKPFFVLYPVKNWKLRLGFINYDQHNLWFYVPVDIALIILTVIRLTR